MPRWPAAFVASAASAARGARLVIADLDGGRAAGVDAVDPVDAVADEVVATLISAAQGSPGSLLGKRMRA